MFLCCVYILVCTLDDRLFELISRLYKGLGVSKLLRFRDIVEARRAAALLLDRVLIYDSRGDSEGVASSRYRALCIYSGLNCLYICDREDKILTEPPAGCLEASAYPCAEDELLWILMRRLYRTSLDMVKRMPGGVGSRTEFMSRYIDASLERLCVKPGGRGHQFLSSAIFEGAANPQIAARTNIIYERVAGAYATTPDNVERMIRYVLVQAWDLDAWIKACVFEDYLRPGSWQASNSVVIRIYSGLVRRVTDECALGT